METALGALPGTGGYPAAGPEVSIVIRPEEARVGFSIARTATVPREVA